MEMRRVLVMNGPNLNLLGMREPDVYGRETLATLEDEVMRYGAQRGVAVTCFQSNSEGALIDRIHQAPGLFDGIVYNPGAHTHYSYALRDAIGSIDLPVVEVHISDINVREPFRRISVIAPVCVAQVKGMGFAGYSRAIDILCDSNNLSRLGEGCAESGASDPEPAACAQSEPHDFTQPFAAGIAASNAGEVSRARLAAIREACAAAGVDALLVRDTSNVQWASAIDGVFDEERAHALLVSASGVALHTDSRYANAIRTALNARGGGIAVNEDRVSHAAFARDTLAAEGAEGANLGFEDTITYAEFTKTRDTFESATITPTSDVVLGLRAVKDAGEIARMKAAQAVTDAAFAHIVGFMRPGMTEREVQLELEDFMVRHGGEGLAFRSIVAAGANGADPHAVPGSTRLEAGQCVVLDFGARAFGYCSDMTRTVFLGEPVGRMREAWDVLRSANEQVEAMLKPGVTGAEAHELAEQVLAQGGFGGRMGHGLGHGVGIDVHELPVLSPRNALPLEPGNVVTVEPGIYLPGEFGMRLEDFGVITAAGYDVFTQSTHDMVVL